MKKYLILKLLAVHVIVIGFVMILIWIAIDTLAAGYFVTLMEKYNISPKPAHAMFIGAVHRYMVWASLAAVILAALLSYLLMRRVLAPLTSMNKISREIAAGNFALRVPAATEDEVGQLAQAFNRMSQSLQKIETLRRNLMIDVAHELRTPLTNIRGYLEALNDGVLPPAADTFALLQNETLRIVQLVEDVLQLAKADAVHGKLNLKPTDLRLLVAEVLDAHAASFQEKSISLQRDLPKKPLKIMADSDRLRRVVRNLTDNAARYTPANGRVSVRIGKQGQSAVLHYYNNCDTPPADDLSYIFERFYRGEKSRSRQHGGAGIGLAIVKELVEAHGGSVAAEWRDKVFHIFMTLPLAP